MRCHDAGPGPSPGRSNRTRDLRVDLSPESVYRTVLQVCPCMIGICAGDSVRKALILCSVILKVTISLRCRCVPLQGRNGRIVERLHGLPFSRGGDRWKCMRGTGCTFKNAGGSRFRARYRVSYRTIHCSCPLHRPGKGEQKETPPSNSMGSETVNQSSCTQC